MPDYQQGKIYKLVSPSNPELVYIGSTVQTLAKRKSQHKDKLILFNQGEHHYTTSCEVIKFDDCRIELIESFPCNSKEELYAREGYFIRTIQCVNKHIPDRTKKQYTIDTKDRKVAYDKEYRTKNAEKIKQRKSIKETCECGSIYNKEGRHMHIKSHKHIDFMNQKGTI